MKLLYCKACGDVFNLRYKEKECECGRTRGQYTDSVHAVYSGDDATMLGFQNSSFADAVEDALPSMIHNSTEFTAFVILDPCLTFVKDK